MAGQRPQDGPGLQRPEPHAAVVAGAREGRAVGAEGDSHDPVLVADEGMKMLAGVRIPEMQPAVVATAGEQSAVWRERDRADPALVVAERAKLRAGTRIPEPDGAVDAGAREHASVGSEADRPNPRLVAAQDAQLLAGVRVPQTHGAVVARARQRRGAGGEGERAHPALVAVQRAHGDAVAWIPETYAAVVAGACEDDAVLRRERHRADAVLVGVNGAQLGGAVRIPQAHAAIGVRARDQVAGRMDRHRGARGCGRRQHRLGVLGIGQRRPERVAAVQGAARQPRAGELRATQTCVVELGAARVGAEQSRRARVAAFELRLDERRAGEVRAHERGARQIGALEVRARHAGVRQVCSREVRARHPGAGVVAAAEVLSGERRVANLHAEALVHEQCAARSGGAFATRDGLPRPFARAIVPHQIAEEVRHQHRHLASLQRVGPCPAAELLGGAIGDEPLHDRLVNERERSLLVAHEQGARADEVGDRVAIE